MRFHQLAETVLTSPARTAVVRTLARTPDKSWTGRELARAAGVSPRWAIDTLRILEEEGAVWRQRVPPASLWTPAPDHVLFELLAPALGVDREAQRMLEAELRRGLSSVRPVLAIWFGSTAQGREAPTSDIDLLVVVRSARDVAAVEAALERMGARLMVRFGNILSSIVLTEPAFRGRKSRGFVKSALQEGRWIVGGPTDG